MIKMIWIGVVLCGIMNGVIYSFVDGPLMVCLMVVVAMICALLVRFHRRKTEDWGNGNDENNYHPIFVCSFAVCLVSVLLALMFLSAAVVLGIFTALLTFLFLADREIDYAGNGGKTLF